MKLFCRIVLAFIVLAYVQSPAYAQPTSERVINAVVNIYINKVRAWDDGYNGSGAGTGFVIDTEKGLILTNRHIVQTGPVVAYAEFSNKKQIPLIPIYRDPVHDFGIFRYNPEDIGDLPIDAISLSEQAEIGEPIILYGNDSGEDLSIIQGVLSRLDRPAPDINNTYSDFNSFYFQAALGTSGGSSGSPILNTKNEAIALNAAGRNDTETAFFLPMQVILPYVEKIRANTEIHRGTLQTEWMHVPFNRLPTLGVDQNIVTSLQQQSATASGKLVVSHVIPEGPADKQLQAGDLLISMNEQIIDDFYQLEPLLNSLVGDTVDIELIRNNQTMNVTLTVDDLFALTPSQYIEYGDAMIIPVGIGMARLFNIPAKGLTLVNPGPVFASQNIGQYALLEEVNQQKILTLDDLEKQLSSIADGARFSVRYRYPQNITIQKYKLVTDYTHWFDNQRCVNINGEQTWQCRPLNSAAAVQQHDQYTNKTQVTSPIVDVSVFRPVKVNHSSDVMRSGQGAIIDYQNGLILTDKSIIDSTLSEIGIVFNNGHSIAGQVVAIHPYLNLAMIQADLHSIRFKKRTLPKLSDNLPQVDETYLFKGKSALKDYAINVFSTWPTVMYEGADHDTNMFDPLPGHFGLYLDDRGDIVAVNTLYEYKKNQHVDIIPVDLVRQFVDAIHRQDKGMYELESGFNYVSYSEALQLGYTESDGEQTDRVLNVAGVDSLGDINLLPGDLVLKVDNVPVSNLNALYRAMNKEELTIQVLRNGTPQDIQVKTRFTEFNRLHDVVFWAGAVIHKTDEKVHLPSGPADSCMAISVYFYGSPVDAADITSNSCVYAIDGEIVETAEDIVRLTKNKSFGDYTKVHLVELTNNFRVAEYRLREDTLYWPNKFWQRQEKQWKQAPLNNVSN